MQTEQQERRQAGLEVNVRYKELMCSGTALHLRHSVMSREAGVHFHWGGFYFSPARQMLEVSCQAHGCSAIMLMGKVTEILS